MKTKVFLFVSLLFIALVVCSKDNGNFVDNANPAVNRAGRAGEMELAITNFTYTGCKTMTRGRILSERFELKTVKDGGLLIKHVDVMFNCVSCKFEAEASITGQHISVTEYDATQSDVMTTCECPYDLGYEIGPLENGVTYNMTIVTTRKLTPEEEAAGISAGKTETTIVFTYSPTLDEEILANYEHEGEIYGKWELDYYTMGEDRVYLWNGSTEGYRCTIELSEDGKAEAHGGNEILGNFTLGDKRQITFSDVKQTEINVDDEDVLFFDEHVLTSTSYIAVYDYLLLYYSDTEYFLFTKNNTSSIDTAPTKTESQHAPTTYDLNGRQYQGSPKSGVVIQNGKKVVAK